MVLGLLFYSLANYGNAGWLREQVQYMCPMRASERHGSDQDTLLTYDAKRGDHAAP